ncbi:MAG: hypothetical protein SGILL_008532 [Bacillariaceae sp.]
MEPLPEAAAAASSRDPESQHDNNRSTRPQLSYMDEMRLAKFARSHRNLNLMRQASTRNLTRSEAQHDASFRQRLAKEGSLHLEDYGVQNDEICGGGNLTEQVIHPDDNADYHTRHRRYKTEDDDQAYRRLSIILGGDDSGAGRRASGLADSSAWASLAHELAIEEEDGEEQLENIDESEGEHPVHIPFYDYPVQRQRWGDPQLLPHINWGDLFFDLFYVGIAYNLGTLLISFLTESEWRRGLVYFLGIFGPLYNMWERKMNYEARYMALDYAHRILEVVRVFLLGFAALHINSLTLLKDPKSIETFALCISIFLESMVHVGLKVELILVGRGDRTAIVNHSKRKLYKTLLPLSLFYLGATICSGVLYFGPYDDPCVKEDYRRMLAEEENLSSCYSDWQIFDLPLALCFIGYIFDILSTSFRRFIKFDPKKLDVRDHFVPTNIDFQIHRYGEFVMLMLGEAVLSLLIVETTELSNYYVTACVGMLNVIVIQILRFDSEPSDANNHCLWRGVKAAYVYSLLIQLLSIALIGFGVSFKVMLATIYSTGDYADANEAVVVDDSAYGDDGDAEHRHLADVPTVTFLTIKCLYCTSLVLVLVAIELLASSHKGFKKRYRVFFKHDKTGAKKIKWRVVLISILKLALLSFLATLPVWVGSHRWLTIIGLVVSIVFAVSHVIDWGFETNHSMAKKLDRALSRAHKINLKSIASNVRSPRGSSIIASLRPGRKNSRASLEKSENAKESTGIVLAEDEKKDEEDAMASAKNHTS